MMWTGPAKYITKEIKMAELTKKEQMCIDLTPRRQILKNM